MCGGTDTFINAKPRRSPVATVDGAWGGASNYVVNTLVFFAAILPAVV